MTHVDVYSDCNNYNYYYDLRQHIFINNIKA